MVAKALGLSSGGLDSILASLILKNNNINISWLSFHTPFFSNHETINAAKKYDIDIKSIDITDELLKILQDEKSTFGKNMNPCKECRILMLKIAGKIMKEENFDFIFTGEVLGQRPMTQTKKAINYIEKQTNLKGYIIRPLCQKLIKAQIAPEIENLIDKNIFLDISGRSRKPQIALAKKYNIKGYQNPAGGCLLTYEGYANKLRDLIKHKKDIMKEDLYCLQYGRHFRLKNDAKLIIGKNQKENLKLKQYYNEKEDILIESKNFAAPLALIKDSTDISCIDEASLIFLAYASKIKENEEKEVHVFYPLDNLIKEEKIKIKKQKLENLETKHIY